MTSWPKARLGVVATHIKDGTHGTHARVESGVPFLSAKNIGPSGKLFWDESDDLISRGEFEAITSVFQPKRDDLLLTIVGSVGRSALFDGSEVAFQRSVAFVRPGPQILPAFLHQASQAVPFTRQLERRSNVTAQAGLYLGELAKVEVPLPPMDAQRRIAAILNGLDKAIEATEALIEKHQQIKAGLMHDLLTRGVLADGRLRPSIVDAPHLYREAAGQYIPTEWQYERLDDLATRGSGHTPNKNVPEYWNEGVKWISLADSHRLDALYISDTEMNISHRGIQNSSAVLHPPGIVVLSRDAGIGKSAITTEPMAVSQHFMCWKCDHRLDNHFLYYWLQFKKRMFENIAMGSTILTIGLPYFKKLRIACPVSIDEQRSIASRLKNADEYLFGIQRQLAKLRMQKLGLMQDLLTGNVRVPVQNVEAIA